MSLREWTFEDLGNIAALERDCFANEAWSQRMLAESFLSEHFSGFLSEEEGQITAYGGVSVVEDEAELQLIATAEMFRRCGRGGAILTAILERAKARGARRIFLEVRVSNAPAMLLYLSHGFKGLYARSRYYPDGEDAIVMEKELS